MQAWKIVEPNHPFLNNWHIDVICEHLEAITAGHLRKLIINMPPRHSKSTLISVMWPAWAWIIKPSTQWLFASYSQSLSTRDSVKCRRIIGSYWYKQQWNDNYRLVADQNQKTRFENNRAGHRIATSVGGSATGEGGDVVCVDDPHNIEERESDVIREGVLKWWDEVMSTRLNNPQTGAHVIVMQRVHEKDLSGHLLAQGGYELLCLEAERETSRKSYSVPRYTDPRMKDGDLLWPARFGPTEIKEAKIHLGSMGYASQFQQRPAPQEGGLAKRGWWRFHNRTAPEKFEMVVQSWDFAFKDEKTSSWVVGQVWGKKGPDLYLLDQDRRKIDFVVSLNAVLVMREKWPSATRILIEDAANGPAIITVLKKKIGGIIPIKAELSKYTRAISVTPQIEAGNVYLPDQFLNPWVQDFIEEWALAPNCADWDQIDSCSQAINYLTRKFEPRAEVW